MLNNVHVPPPALFLGDLIAARRRELGHSQREFADLVCAVSGRPTITRGEISRYERETRIPNAAGLLWLATALRLPLPLVRQAVVFTRRRRHLRDNYPEPMPHLCPGYLFGPSNDTNQPQPMILIGADLCGC